MYTSFCQDCKSTLSGLWESVQKIHAQQTRNADNKVFQPAYAEAANAKLEQQKKDACAAARERINAICDRAHEDAATLDEINPFAVSDDYMKLLSGAFDLTIPQVQHIATECQKSPTMLSAIDAYCKRHEMRLNRATAESRRSGIENVRESALGVVSRIEATSFKNGNRDLSVGLSVSDFCRDGEHANELYGRLGQRFSGEIFLPSWSLKTR